MFDVANQQQAKQIILTPEGGASTEERWERETPFLSRDIGAFLEPSSRSVVLDYGCGLGRIARELIISHGCRVLGVDISSSMRQLAPGYVADERFSIISVPMFASMVDHGLRVSSAYTAWVLQHCPNVAQAVNWIKSSIQPKGRFYVLNNNRSAVPINNGWVNDGVDIKALLESEFTLQGYSRLPQEASVKAVIENTFIGKFVNDKIDGAT